MAKHEKGMVVLRNHYFMDEAKAYKAFDAETDFGQKEDHYNHGAMIDLWKSYQPEQPPHGFNGHDPKLESIGYGVFSFGVIPIYEDDYYEDPYCDDSYYDSHYDSFYDGDHFEDQNDLEEVFEPPMVQVVAEDFSDPFIEEDLFENFAAFPHTQSMRRGVWESLGRKNKPSFKRRSNEGPNTRPFVKDWYKSA